MTYFDFGVMAVFTLLVLVLGVSFSKSGQSVKSFFAAGGAVPWWIASLSMFMSFFSVGTFVVWGSIAYNTGFVAIVIQTTMSLAGFAVGYFIAPKWNQTKAMTAAEFISDRAGSKAQKFYSYIFLFISLFGAGAFLYPVGKMLEVTTGMSLETAIVLLGAVIILYTAVGGLWAVLVTDVLQFVVLTAAVLIVVPLAFEHVGSVSRFIEQTPEDFFALTNSEFDWFFMAAFGFYNMVFIGGSWAFVQRFTSVSTPKDARKVGVTFGALYLFAPLVWMLPPMIYRVINPELSGKEVEGAYLMVSQLVVPDGLMGLILGAMVFATASSVNTTLNISASVFTNDIYKQFMSNVNEHNLMTVARVTTVVFGLVAIGVALSVTHLGGIVEVVFSLAAITGVALFLPPIWAMFSRVQTGKTMIVTSVLSLSVNGVFKFITPVLFEFNLSRSTEMVVGVVVPVLLLGFFEVIARFGKQPCQAYEQYLVKWQSKNQPYDSNAESSNDAIENSDANVFGQMIIAIGIGCTGIILAILGALAEKGAGIIVVIATITLIVAYFVFPTALMNSKVWLGSTDKLENSKPKGSTDA